MGPFGGESPNRFFDEAFPGSLFDTSSNVAIGERLALSTGTEMASMYA